jgi:hypothetical protein
MVFMSHKQRQEEEHDQGPDDDGNRPDEGRHCRDQEAPLHRCSSKSKGAPRPHKVAPAVEVVARQRARLP